MTIGRHSASGPRTRATATVRHNVCVAAALGRMAVRARPEGEGGSAAVPTPGNAPALPCSRKGRGYAEPRPTGRAPAAAPSADISSRRLAGARTQGALSHGYRITRNGASRPGVTYRNDVAVGARWHDAVSGSWTTPSGMTDAVNQTQNGQIAARVRGLRAARLRCRRTRSLPRAASVAQRVCSSSAAAAVVLEKAGGGLGVTLALALRCAKDGAPTGPIARRADQPRWRGTRPQAMAYAYCRRRALRNHGRHSSPSDSHH